jgi:hypothetical protein
MFDIYVSWAKGLPQDKEALELIKKSGVVAGIELSRVGQDIELIKASGLHYNLHNPLRDYKMGLDSQYFVPTMERLGMLSYCALSKPSVIGFHTGYSSLMEKDSSKEKIMANTLRSIKFLDQNLDKKIIFESTVYQKNLFHLGDKKLAAYVTSSQFFKEIIQKSGAGFLFDVSHNFISGKTKIMEKEYFGTIEDYFAEILEVVAKETFQMHFNIPNGDNKKGFVDTHGIIKPSRTNSKQLLLLAKEIIDSCPNIKTVTLEMDTPNCSPKKHAKILIQQTEILQKYLG